MNEDRRSPYLILAVPYGTDARSASAAFARRAKQARRDPDFPYDLDDLTWALHQIEHATADAAADLGTFRVPADPGALDAPSDGSEHFPSILLSRRTAEPTDADCQTLETYARAEAFDELVTLSAQNTAERYRLDEHQSRLEQPTFVAAPRKGPSPVVVVAVVLAVVLVVALALVAATLSERSGSSAPNTVPPVTTSAPTTVAPTSTVAEESAPEVNPVVEYLPFVGPGLDLSQPNIAVAQELFRIVCCPEVPESRLWDAPTVDAADRLRRFLGLSPSDGLDEDLWLAVLSSPAPDELGDRPSGFLGLSVPDRAVRYMESTEGDPFFEAYVLSFEADLTSIVQWAEERYDAVDLRDGAFASCGEPEPVDAGVGFAWRLDEDSGIALVVEEIAAGRVDVVILEFDLEDTFCSPD